MSCYVALDLAFVTSAPDPEAFEDYLDRIMDAFADIGVEADLTASLAKYEATFVIPTTGMSTDALMKALGDLRTALHAAGCGTAGWPSCDVLRAETRSEGRKGLTAA